MYLCVYINIRTCRHAYTVCKYTHAYSTHTYTHTHMDLHTHKHGRTVFPNKQNRGILRPTMPLTHGPCIVQLSNTTLYTKAH